MTFNQVAGLAELLLVFGGVLAILGWQLWSLRKSAGDERARRDGSDPR